MPPPSLIVIPSFAIGVDLDVGETAWTLKEWACRAAAAGTAGVSLESLTVASGYGVNNDGGERRDGAPLRGDRADGSRAVISRKIPNIRLVTAATTTSAVWAEWAVR